MQIVDTSSGQLDNADLPQITKLAEEFVKENIIQGRDKFDICADGRHEYESIESGGVSLAGGSMGFVIGLLAFREQLGWSVEDVVNKTIDVYRKHNKKFVFHTDDHSDNSKLCGCAHISSAESEEFESEYGVIANDVRKAYGIIKGLSSDMAMEVMLKGSHNEKGILFLRGELTKTVNHQDISGTQYFVIDVDRRDDFVRKTLIPRLGIESTLTADEFINTLNTQTQTTTRKVAKGLPMFDIDLSHVDPQVRFIDKVTS